MTVTAIKLLEDLNSLVSHGRILERYEHPSMRPLCEQDFRVYDNSRRQIHLIKARINALINSEAKP